MCQSKDTAEKVQHARHIVVNHLGCDIWDVRKFVFYSKKSRQFHRFNLHISPHRLFIALLLIVELQFWGSRRCRWRLQHLCNWWTSQKNNYLLTLNFSTRFWEAVSAWQKTHYTVIGNFQEQEVLTKCKFRCNKNYLVRSKRMNIQGQMGWC